MMKGACKVAALVLLCSDVGAMAQDQREGGMVSDEKVRNEIIVLGKKAKLVRIKFKINDRTRKAHCKIVRSSGDKAFDQTMCQPVYRCANIQPLDVPTVRQCMDRAREEVLREWAEARVAQ